jgi:hypothetical protein
MKNNDIFLYWYSKSALTMIERADMIMNYSNTILRPLSIDLFAPFKERVNTNITDNEIKDALLKQIKEPVRKFYKKKEVADDFSENIASDIWLRSNGFLFKFAIGGSGNLPNSVVIEIPVQYQEKAKDILVKSIGYFDPEWGVLTQFSFWTEITNQANEEYKFGWMTYFSKEVTQRIMKQLNGVSLLKMIFNTKSNFNDYIKVIEEEVYEGKLLISTHEVFDTSNPTHVKQAKVILDFFKKNKIFMQTYPS